MNPKSKPPTKKKPAIKTVRKPQLLAPEFDSRLIDGIAACVEELAAELKRANKKLDYVVDYVVAHQRADEDCFALGASGHTKPHANQNDQYDDNRFDIHHRPLSNHR
jgi:hypothetical protein